MPTDLSLWTSGAIGLALGLLIGSYLATLVVRWPGGEQASSGRSRCDACAAPLGAADLVPLLSFVLRRGRCGACRAAIDRTHPAIEAACGTIGAAAFLLLPGWTGVAGAILGWLLLALAVLDWRHFWLPDRLVLALAGTGLGGLVAGVPPVASERAIGGAAAFAALWTIAWLYRRTRGRDGMGGGDPKLFGALGLWFGWRPLPLLLLGASLLGLCLALVARSRGQEIARHHALPFGTLIAAVGWPLWLWLAASGRLG